MINAAIIAAATNAMVAAGKTEDSMVSELTIGDKRTEHEKRLIALLTEAVDVIRLLEWSMVDANDRDGICPACFGRRESGHYPACYVSTLRGGIQDTMLGFGYAADEEFRRWSTDPSPNPTAGITDRLCKQLYEAISGGTIDSKECNELLASWCKRQGI